LATNVTFSGASVLLSGLGASTGTPDSVCLNTNTVTRNAALTCTVSSRDYKTAIHDFGTDPTTLLMGLRPVEFAYKDHPERIRWGFIAEEAASVNRRLADGFDPTGTARSLDQNAILALLVKAAQKQQVQIDRLESKANGK
jgi:hypothetical protein